MEPAIEQLDLEALVKGGTIKGSRPGQSGLLPPPGRTATPGAPTAAAGAAASATPALASLGMFEDDAIVEDTSSWSSDEGDDVEEDKESSEEVKKPETSVTPADEAQMVDPLGLLGKLNTSDPRFDLSSVKFDPVALLSGVHSDTTYEKLRTALETLKAAQGPQEKQLSIVAGLGMIEGNNFDRFVATSNTVVTLREGIVRAGLGGGQWSKEMDEGLEKTARDVDELMSGVFKRREQTRSQLRVVRFVGRYRTVLKLPETLRSLISSPSGYGQAAREYRKAQRVLRGAAGPVFRQVLKELEDVAAKWKASLYQKLAIEFFGSTGAAEHIVEATRALRELGSSPEPGMYFSQQQMHFAQHRMTNAGPSVSEMAKIVPGLRLGYAKLGAGTADGSLQAGVWGVTFDLCVEAVKASVQDAEMEAVLTEAQQLWERLGECVQGSAGGKERQPCYTSVGGLVQWLKQKVARRITLQGLRDCGSKPDVIRSSVHTMQLLAPVIGDLGALDVGFKCLSKGVDLIVQKSEAAIQSPFAASWDDALPPEKGSPEEALLECVSAVRRLYNDGSAAMMLRAATAGTDTAASVERLSSSPTFFKSSALFTSLCRCAEEHALQGYIARMAHFVRLVVARGMELEAQEEFQRKLDGKGALEEVVYAAALQSNSSGPQAQTERSALSEWAQEVVQVLIVVRSHVDARLPDDTMPLMEALAEMVFFVVEEVCEREREVLGRNLSMRWGVSLRFLCDVLSFSKRVTSLAAHLISKQLKVKVPPGLEKAAVLRRCFAASEEASSANGKGFARNNATSPMNLSRLAGTNGPVAVFDGRKASRAPEEASEGRPTQVATPVASRPKQEDAVPRTEAAPSKMGSSDDSNPFAAPKAVPAKQPASRPIGLTNSGTRSLSAIERKSDSSPMLASASPPAAESNPFGVGSTPKQTPKAVQKAADASNLFASASSTPKSTNPFA